MESEEERYHIDEIKSLKTQSKYRSMTATASAIGTGFCVIGTTITLHYLLSDKYAEITLLGILLTGGLSAFTMYNFKNMLLKIKEKVECDREIHEHQTQLDLIKIRRENS